MKLTTPRCRICRRTLTDPNSIAKGIGPECAEKFAAMLVGAGLTLEALNIPESISTDRVVARYLHMAEQALLRGETAHVERFKDAARGAAQRLCREAALEAKGYVIIATSDDPPETCRVEFSMEALKPECRGPVAEAMADLFMPRLRAYQARRAVPPIVDPAGMR